MSDAFNEFAIEWYRGDKTAKISAPSGSRIKNRVKALKKNFPDEVEIVAENLDGSIFAEVPVSWVKISRPREMSKEQREQARERLKRYRRTSAQNDETEATEEEYFETV